MSNPDLNHDRLLCLATLAQLAYVAHKQGEEVVKNIITWGCQPFISPYPYLEFLYNKSLFNTNTPEVCCGLIVANDQEIIISIRGTENLDDYYLNLLAHVNEDYIHTGFVTYVDSFWTKLFQTLIQLDDHTRNIYLIGHSLGGAAAIILTHRLQSYYLHPPKSYRLLTYTFGTPPVSSRKITLHTPLYQFHNEGDFIPFLPQTLSLSLDIIPGVKSLFNTWNPTLVKTISDYNHQGDNYLITRDYQIKYIQEQEYITFSPQFYLPRIFSTSWLSFNPIDIFKKLIHSIIEKSLEEHRALTYVERLSYGVSPSWMVKRLPSEDT